MTAPYLLRPIIVLGLLVIVAGPTPTLVNPRRAEFSAKAVIHGVFPGIVVGMTLGGRGAIIPGRVVYVAPVAATLTVTSHKPRHSEAMTTVLLTALFSPGIVIFLRIGDMSGQLEPLAFGRLLDITLSRMGAGVVMLMLAAALFAFIWCVQVAVAFNHEASRANGTPVTWIGVIFNAALGAIVAVVSTTVGVLLAVEYLIVPDVSGHFLAAGPRSTVLLAGICASVGEWAGFGTSFLRAPCSLSPQVRVALGVLVCPTGACVFREVRVHRIRLGPATCETVCETNAVGGGE